MALKMSIFKILKNGLEFYFILSYEPTIPKTMIPQQKMWAGCYRLLPPTQKRSEFGPWQSLSRDVLEQDLSWYQHEMYEIIITTLLLFIIIIKRTLFALLKLFL